MNNTIAILGLGAMGSRMARRLLDAERDVVVYNRSEAPLAALVERGARAAATPRLAAEGAGVVLSMVRDDGASEQVWAHPEHGALLGMQPGALAVESSTLSVAWVLRLAQAAKTHGVSLVDAPVVGTRPHAQAGTLVHLLGGDALDVERLDATLSVLGGARHHVGPTGRGMAMKLAVNAMFGLQVAALAELLAALKAEGIAVEQAVQVLGAMPTSSPAAHAAAQLIARQVFDPLFPVALVDKDLGYLLEIGRGRTPVVEATRAVFARAHEAGLGGDNIVGVAKLYTHA